MADIKLHANATTTPATRAYIARSPLGDAALSRELNISIGTVRRWRSRRGEVQDRSHARHNIGTSIQPHEEELIVELRRDLGLSLDDIVEVMKRCVNPALARASVHRCLKRHAISGRPPVPAAPRPGRFPDEPCGFIHMDLKHLTRLRGAPAYVFVAIDRATRFVFVEVHPKRDAATAVGFLTRFLAAFPAPVRVILTDNGSEFTDRFSDATKNKTPGKPSGRHPFDRACRDAAIEHRLTKPFCPKTNGMVERFNRRLAETVRAQQNIHARRKFDTHAERNAFITTFVSNYNKTKLRCLQYRAPLELLSNLPGHNTCADHDHIRISQPS